MGLSIIRRQSNHVNMAVEYQLERRFATSLAYRKRRATELTIDRTRRLTQSIARGEPDAFDEYYDRYFDVMFRFARSLTGADESTCLDIVHDSMFKAIRSMKPMDDQRHLTAWSHAIVRSVAYDWLRKKSRASETSLEQIEFTDRSIEGVDDDALVRMAWIEQQVAELDADLRRMMSLRYRWGWTLGRIARSFGLKTGTVDGRIRRAVEKLRQQAQLQFDE